MCTWTCSAGEFTKWSKQVGALAKGLKEANEREAHLEELQKCRKQWEELETLLKESHTMEGHLSKTLPDIIEQIEQAGCDQDVAASYRNRLRELHQESASLMPLMEQLRNNG